MRFAFFICLFASASLSFAAERLKSDFACEEVTTASGCKMQMCEGKVPSYPEKVLVTIPSEVARVSFHFHGYILGVLHQYEKSLSSMIEAFGIQESLCKKNEATVFPKSTGRCTTFRSAFATPDQFNSFALDVSNALRKDWSPLPITLSAHSGGGKIISSLLANIQHEKTGTAIQRVDRALYYDAIYSDSVLAPTRAQEIAFHDRLSSGEVGDIEKWYKNNSEVQIKMMMATSSPRKYAQKVIDELSEAQSVKTSTLTMNAKTFRLQTLIQNQKSVEYYGTLKSIDTTAGHYGVLTDTWEATH